MNPNGSSALSGPGVTSLLCSWWWASSAASSLQRSTVRKCSREPCFSPAGWPRPLLTTFLSPQGLSQVHTVVRRRVSLQLSGGSYTRGGRPSHQAGANLCSSDSTAEGSQALGGPLSTVVTERERSFRHATPSLGRCLDSESQINGAEPERRAGPAIQVLLMENRPFPCLKTDCCGCQCHLESGSLWGPRSLY